MKQSEDTKKETAAQKENTRQEPESRGKAEKEAAEKPEEAKTPDSKDNPEAALEKKLKEAEEHLSKQKDQLLRTAAEYDNYRKRTEREKTTVYTDATAAAVLEFLPVADNLERALAQKTGADDDMRRGIEMVRKQMDGALAKLGVTEIGGEGEPFDPNLHNAVSHVEDEKAGENTVVKVLQKGYKIGDRVVRHAMVQVAN